MAANTYHFITHWRVESTVEEVFDIISDAQDLARWWPSVYLGGRVWKGGGRKCGCRSVEVFTKGWLPYTLRWQFRITEANPPFFFSLEAWGDFVGSGIWQFQQEDSWVHVTYDWQLRAEKPLLRALSGLLKPVFSANHHWAMARGEESLKLEIRRRHATNDADAKIQPPGPTFPHNIFRSKK